MEITVEEKSGFWAKHWGNVIGWIFLIAVVGGLLFMITNYFSDRHAEKVRIEASKFEINGVIENVREEHAVEKFGGLLEFTELVESVYVQIDGVEYRVNDNLTDLDFLTTGQLVKAKGEEGRIDTVSISK